MFYVLKFFFIMKEFKIQIRQVNNRPDKFGPLLSKALVLSHFILMCQKIVIPTVEQNDRMGVLP